MKNHIENLKIKNIFFRKNIHWDLKQVNVLVGKNGLGKTTILNLINSALTHNPCKYLDICDEVIVNLYNKEKYHALKENLTEDILNKMIQEISTSNDVVDSIIKSIVKDQKLSIPNRKIENRIRKEIKEKIISEIKLDLTPKEGKKQKSGYKFGVNVKPIETVFISTSNMNVSATNDVMTSSGSHVKFLNVEINHEIEKLIKNDKKNPDYRIQEKFIESLNTFLVESKKKAVISKNVLEILLYDDNILDFEYLSSGERQILFILLKVANSAFDGTIILMDEPEISLHLSWQEKLLDEITKLNSSSQIIIVTHSPAIVMNGWFDCLTEIKDIFVDSTEDI